MCNVRYAHMNQTYRGTARTCSQAEIHFCSLHVVARVNASHGPMGGARSVQIQHVPVSMRMRSDVVRVFRIYWLALVLGYV